MKTDQMKTATMAELLDELVVAVRDERYNLYDEEGNQNGYYVGNDVTVEELRAEIDWRWAYMQRVELPAWAKATRYEACKHCGSIIHYGNEDPMYNGCQSPHCVSQAIRDRNINEARQANEIMKDIDSGDLPF